jgi:hypothetical protein
VIPTAGSGNTDTFVVNGQRETSNYWTVDGVSANFGIGGNIGNPGAGLGGQAGATSLPGGTNSLVSVDALQEFRIGTSTAAPDSGLTAGGQISIVTRSGTNQFHGSLFDYFRNTVLDANNWFNGVNVFNSTPLPKAPEQQNDFGGTVGGPIRKDRTFFFFSYEGLRLRLPQTALTQVPDLQARQDAIPAVQQFLNAYPFDPKQPDLGDGVAQFNASYSNPSSLDAYSLRIDDRLTDKLNLFGRYNYSPSSIAQDSDLDRALPFRFRFQRAVWLFAADIGTVLGREQQRGRRPESLVSVWQTAFHPIGLETVVLDQQTWRSPQ